MCLCWRSKSTIFGQFALDCVSPGSEAKTKTRQKHEQLNTTFDQWVHRTMRGATAKQTFTHCLTMNMASRARTLRSTRGSLICFTKPGQVLFENGDGGVPLYCMIKVKWLFSSQHVKKGAVRVSNILAAIQTCQMPTGDEPAALSFALNKWQPSHKHKEHNFAVHFEQSLYSLWTIILGTILKMVLVWRSFICWWVELEIVSAKSELQPSPTCIALL